MNDAERLRHDPAMRWIVGGKAAQRSAASPSQMGRFETQWLAAPKNFAALAHLSGQWIDLMHGRRPPRGIVLDMDSNQNSWTAHRPDQRRARLAKTCRADTGMAKLLTTRSFADVAAEAFICGRARRWRQLFFS